MKKRILALFILIVLIAVGLSWWKFSLLPVNATDNTEQSFIVGKGQGVREIAKKLDEANLIRDPIAFFILVRQKGIEKNIQAGSFKLKPSMSSGEIALALTTGTEDVWITIPEGWRAEQVAEYLGKTNDFWNDGLIAPSTWQEYEGHLFPETYLVPREMSLDRVRDLLTTTFESRLTPDMRAAINSSGYSLDEILTIASLIEREARHDADRPLVASVIHNRLKEGMKLDIDATVQYAVGYTAKDGWWKKSLTLEDLKIDSPYNTYTNPGLPSGPICSPGVEALTAAIYPAKTGYLFYISDRSGNNHYATTLDEHNTNIAKYLDN